jgi:hypothetical protein
VRSRHKPLLGSISHRLEIVAAQRLSLGAIRLVPPPSEYSMIRLRLAAASMLGQGGYCRELLHLPLRPVPNQLMFHTSTTIPNFLHLALWPTSPMGFVDRQARCLPVR